MTSIRPQLRGPHCWTVGDLPYQGQRLEVAGGEPCRSPPGDSRDTAAVTTPRPAGQRLSIGGARTLRRRRHTFAAGGPRARGSCSSSVLVAVVGSWGNGGKASSPPTTTSGQHGAGTTPTPGCTDLVSHASRLGGRGRCRPSSRVCSRGSWRRRCRPRGRGAGRRRRDHQRAGGPHDRECEHGEGGAARRPGGFSRPPPGHWRTRRTTRPAPSWGPGPRLRRRRPHLGVDRPVLPAGVRPPARPPARSPGRLPQPRSDASAVVIGRTAYVVGGYDGTNADPHVLATTNGSTFRVGGSLLFRCAIPPWRSRPGDLFLRRRADRGNRGRGRRHPARRHGHGQDPWSSAICPRRSSARPPSRWTA